MSVPVADLALALNVSVLNQLFGTFGERGEAGDGGCLDADEGAAAVLAWAGV